MWNKIGMFCSLTIVITGLIILYSTPPTPYITRFEDPDLQISETPSPFHYPCATDWQEGDKYVLESRSTLNGLVTNRRMCSTARTSEIFGGVTGAWTAMEYEGEKGWLDPDNVFISMDELYTQFPAYNYWQRREKKGAVPRDHCKEV